MIPVLGFCLKLKALLSLDPDFMKRKSVFFVLLLFAFFLGCKTETNEVYPFGELKGTVVSSSKGLEGVRVQVEGSNPYQETATDASGHFDFTNLSAGTYNIVFSKDSFPAFKALGFKFFGGISPCIVGPFFLTRLPYNKVLSVEADTTSYAKYEYFVHFSCTLSSSSNTLYRYFISDSKDVSCNNYKVTDVANYNTGTNLYFYTSSSNHQLNYFKAGSRLYIVVYPTVSNEDDLVYFDEETGLTAYPVNNSLSSQTVDFVIPETKFNNH